MKKYIKFILLFILVLFPISILGEENNLVNDVSTKACNVSITDISILDENNSESKTMDLNHDAYNSNISVYLHEIGASVTYRIILKNDSDNSYSLKELMSFKYSPYIEYSYKYENDHGIIDAHSTNYVDVTVKLVAFPDNMDEYEEDNLLSLNSINNSDITNPKTGLSNPLCYVLFVIVGIIVFMLLKHKDIFKKLNIFLIIMAIIMIPISLKAASNSCDSININTKVYLNKYAELLPGVEQANIEFTRTYYPEVPNYYKYNKFVGAISSICDYKTIEHIKIVDTLPSDANTVIVSTEDSALPIYAYYDKETNTLNLYTEAKKIKLNDSSAFLFFNFINLKDIDIFDTIDTSKVTNMSRMFADCSSLTRLDLGNFDTSKVTDMSEMFEDCTNLTSLDLSNFDTSKVTNMSWMFENCRSLTSLDLSKFNTSKVTDMSNMFSYCTNLRSLDLSNFDTSKVTNMSVMFDNCRSLTSLDLSSFDTSKVTEMAWMFSYCTNLTNLDLSSFDTSNVVYMSVMFDNCRSLRSLDVSNFDTSKVTEMAWMFSYCTNLTRLDLGNFDTSNVTDMQSMFANCRKLTSLDLGNFDTSKVTNMSYMFSHCENLTSLDLSNFDTSKVTDMLEMFAYCNNLKTIYGNNFALNNVTKDSSMFYGCSSLVGGSGTTYQSTKVDRSYAHIDGGTSNPGYFTKK